MFMLFAGDSYYPAGGWRDFIGVFPSVEAAVEHFKSGSWDWYHVVSFGEGIVASGGRR